MSRCPCFVVTFTFVSSIAFSQDAPPVSLDDRLKIELFAEHPQLVTPTGIDVDHLGRVFVIESNTHFPPDGYAGHPTDRVLILENTDDDPQADKITVFADGLTHTMSVAVEPIWLSLSGGRKPPVDAQPGGLRPPLRVFIATRAEILLLTDTDGDLKADETKRLVHLETKGNYPHNGLAGFAFDALGNMFFGFGENLGADYKIIGSDGTTLSGGGEGGNLYRCKPDGSKLERWATGFWNPHASCFDAFGRLFTVDNDPDSRPPCRLLHIIPGGDYGYRFRNGRKGTHPFTSWNGEIPGTLPMVAGTGEAPSGIVCYENDGFPDDYLGTILVGSWGDHRIDQFVLEPKGASFTSKAKPIIKGGENFRPVGLAVAPDGSLYFSDWVLKDYKLHGKGRVWRVSAKKAAAAKRPDVIAMEKESIESLKELTDSRNLTVRRMAAHTLRNSEEGRKSLPRMLVEEDCSSRQRIEAMWTILTTPVELHHFHINPNTRRQPPIGFYSDDVGTAFLYALAFNRTAQVDCEDWSLNEFEMRENDQAWFRTLRRRRTESEALRFNLASHYVNQHIYPTIWLSDFGLNEEQEKQNPEDQQVLNEKSNDDLDESMNENDDNDEPILDTSIDYLNDPFFVAARIDAVQNRRGVADEHNSRGPALFQSNTLVGMNISTSQCIGMVPVELAIPTVVRIVHLRAAKNRQERRLREDSMALRLGLIDPAVEVRRAAVQWVGEENLKEHRWLVEAILAQPTTTPDLFLACLATLQLLDGKPASEFEKNPPMQYVAAMVKDAGRPAALRATALRMLPANAPELDAPLLTELLSSNDETLRIETVRTLASSQLPEVRTLLLPIAANPQASAESRAEAVAGLCHGPHEKPLPPEIEALLLKFARGDIDVELSDASQKRRAVETLQLEALRSLRGRAVAGSNIRKTVQAAGELASDGSVLKEAVQLLLNGKRTKDLQPSILDPQPSDDPSAGRRVFFHHDGPLCAKCHTVQGRGGQIGPDLTVIARTMDREKLLASILEPSKEISPQFTTWVIATTSGKTHTGFILEDNRTGQIKLGTPTGEVIVLEENDIETREPSKLSVMPEKLRERMTTQELRDLLAFLESLK